MKILITCSGGKFIFQIIEALKSSKKKHEIIGTDTNKDVNTWYLDKFEKVPEVKKSKTKFINKILYLCKKYKINFILPGSDIETLEISKNQHLFKKINVNFELSSFKTVEKLFYKSKFYKFQNENQICKFLWFKINNLKMLEKIVKKNFLKKEFIIKPEASAGARNSFYVNKKIKKIKKLNDREFISGNWSDIRKYILNNQKNLKNFIVMEYFDGKTYDVDIIAKQGIPVLIKSRLRIWKNKFSSVSEGCKIVDHKKINKLCGIIVKKLNINGPCDFDVIEKGNKIYFIDASCRLSGSVGSVISSGINIPEILLDLSNKNMPKVKNIKDNMTFFPVQTFFNKEKL